MKLNLKLSVFALMFSVLTGCATSNLSDSAKEALESGTLSAFSPITHSSDWYKSIIDNAAEKDHLDYSILIARSYIKERNFEKAKIWLEHAKKISLTQLQESKVHIAYASLMYEQENYTGALSELKKVNSLLSLSNRECANYYVILANTQKRLGNIEEAYHSYVALNHYLTDRSSDAFKKNQEQIISILLSQNLSTLHDLKNKASSQDELGYLDFAINHVSSDPSQYAALDAAWLNRYPDHPARILIDSGTPDKFRSNSNIMANLNGNISQIAVLMPLSGKLAGYGDAFRHGIMMAQREQGLNSSIKYYDVNGTDAKAVYDQAVNDGAQFVIGPLTKDDVSKIITSGTTVPTLAINSFDYVSSNNAFFFAITPENEGAQAAQKIFNDGKRTPLLMIPDTEKGNRIITGFQQKWFENNEYSKLTIKRFKNKNEVTKAIQDSFEDSTSNIDAVYICGTAMEASMIKSQIQVNYPSGDRSFYITGNSNPGNLKAPVTKNMKGMYLGDMPWLIEDSELKQTIKESLDTSNMNTLIFFALGYDSITIVPHIKSMVDNNIPVNGLTGRLTVGKNGKVVNESYWVEIN